MIGPDPSSALQDFFPNRFAKALSNIINTELPILPSPLPPLPSPQPCPLTTSASHVRATCATSAHLLLSPHPYSPSNPTVEPPPFFPPSPTFPPPTADASASAAVRRQDMERPQAAVTKASGSTAKCPRASRAGRRPSKLRMGRGDTRIRTATTNFFLYTLHIPHIKFLPGLLLQTTLSPQSLIPKPNPQFRLPTPNSPSSLQQTQSPFTSS